MKLTPEQSQSLIKAIKKADRPLAHIARKYGLNYYSLRSWMRGEGTAEKLNRFMLFEAAMLAELGWKK